MAALAFGMRACRNLMRSSSISSSGKAAAAIPLATGAIRPAACAAVMSRRTEMTQALVLEEVGKLSLREIDVCEPFTDDDVRIDIKSVGICGSDVHYYQHGVIGPFVVKQPMILGHEASGIVTEVGANVTHLNVGDRVCMEPGVPDPNSAEARLGMYNLCRKLRFWATPPYAQNLLDDPAWAAGHGCLRPSVVHPGNYTFKLPDNVSLDEGAMVEPLAVGMHASTMAKVRPGDVCAVVGAGPIGFLTALSALAAGCSKVYLSDLSDARLKVAESLAPGKIVGLDARGDVRKDILEATNGWGADIIFECSGSPPGAKLVPFLGCPGAKAVFIGCPPDTPISIGELQVREMQVLSVFRYAHVYAKAIAMLESGLINVKPIITNHWDFEDSVAAFDFSCNPPDDTIKSVIHMP